MALAAATLAAGLAPGLAAALAPGLGDGLGDGLVRAPALGAGVDLVRAPAAEMVALPSEVPLLVMFWEAAISFRWNLPATHPTGRGQHRTVQPAARLC